MAEPAERSLANADVCVEISGGKGAAGAEARSKRRQAIVMVNIDELHRCVIATTDRAAWSCARRAEVGRATQRNPRPTARSKAGEACVACCVAWEPGRSLRDMQTRRPRALAS